MFRTSNLKAYLIKGHPPYSRGNTVSMRASMHVYMHIFASFFMIKELFMLYSVNRNKRKNWITHSSIITIKKRTKGDGKRLTDILWCITWFDWTGLRKPCFTHLTSSHVLMLYATYHTIKAIVIKVKKDWNHQQFTCTHTHWCLRIPFWVWNHHKVSQCWEISQWSLMKPNEVSEGLKPVQLCVI